MKKYIAKTNVSINIVLASGKNLHISFSSLTGGGSVFYTDDPEIEKALENHYKYGTLFRIDQHYTPEKPRSKPVRKVQQPAPAPVVEENHASVSEAPSEPTPIEVSDAASDTLPETETTGDETGADECEDSECEDSEAEFKTVIVTDPDAAKAYLAEHFGISRTKLKKVETIKKVAAENGIVFQGI